MTAYSLNFKDLSPEAQEYALKKADRDLNYEWWSATYDNAEEFAEHLGITITDISFSGFWSQGDGCAFCGTICIDSMKTAVEKITENYANDEKLKELAEHAECVFKEIQVAQGIRRLAPPENDPNLDCEYLDTDQILRIDSRQRGFNTAINADLLSGEDTFTLEESVNTFLEGIASHIYECLEKDYDYLTSDEYIIEGWESNDQKFDEDGVEL